VVVQGGVVYEQRGAPHAAGEPHIRGWKAPAASTFTPAELSRCTNKYAQVLGMGSCGTVYGGTLLDGRRVAVKQMELASAALQKKRDKAKLGGGKGSRDDPYAGEAGFRRELEVLSKYAHPHLVALLGHCVEKQRLKATKCSLVLEFMAGGALGARIRPSAVATALTAQERLDIAADVARALYYLHVEASPPLIHQDLKSDNVLLTTGVGARVVAKVADFGTARMLPQLAAGMPTTARGANLPTHHSTGIVVGTRPYMAPEYAQLGHVSEKTDAFAYGVLLLELLTGKPPYNEGTNTALHAACYDLLCDPAQGLGRLLDARVPAASWFTAAGGMGSGGPEGAVAGRALELCLVAKHCLDHERKRGTLREVTAQVVALAAARH